MRWFYDKGFALQEEYLWYTHCWFPRGKDSILIQSWSLHQPEAKSNIYIPLTENLQSELRKKGHMCKQYQISIYYGYFPHCTGVLSLPARAQCKWMLVALEKIAGTWLPATFPAVWKYLPSRHRILYLQAGPEGMGSCLFFSVDNYFLRTIMLKRKCCSSLDSNYACAPWLRRGRHSPSIFVLFVCLSPLCSCILYDLGSLLLYTKIWRLTYFEL